MEALKTKLKRILRWSERYARTDMLYLARGGFWTSLNFVVTGLSSLLLAVAFANLVPKETYGTYRYILSIAGAFGFLSLSGMNAAVTRAVARGHDGALPESVRVQMRWNLLYTLTLAAAGAYYLVRHDAVALGVSLLILGALTPPAWAYATYSAFLSGKKAFKRSAQLSILGTSLYVLVMIVGIVFGRTAVWIVAAYAVGTLVVYALLYALTIAEFRPGAIEEGERHEMIGYGKHLSLLNVVAVVAQQIDNIVVFKFVGPAELAVYAFANLMPERLRKFAKTGMGILVPKLAEKDLKDVVRSLRLRFLQSFSLGALAAGAYWIIAPFVFRWLFPQYANSVYASRLVGLNLAFALPLTYIAYVFQAQKMLRQIYASSLVGNVARAAMIVAGGWYAGMLGVILGKLAGGAFCALFSYLLLERSLRRPVASEGPIV